MLKELLQGQEAIRRQRGILVPRINEYLLLQRAQDKPSRYPLWLVDHRLQPSRLDQRFHPSELADDFCPREWAIRHHELGDVDDGKRSMTSQTQRYYEIGDHNHSLIQFWLADMGLLYGRWECIAGHSFWALAPKRCKQCEQPVIFCEVPIDHESSGLLGHCDGEVIIPPPKFVREKIKRVRIGLEIKSRNNARYKGTAKEPEPRDKEQAVWYLWSRTQVDGVMTKLGESSKISKYPLVGVVVLYFNRDTMQMREHLIRLTREVKDTVVLPRLREMRVAKKFVPVRLETLPRRTCRTHAEGRMRKCDRINSCFSLPSRKKGKQS